MSIISLSEPKYQKLSKTFKNEELLKRIKMIEEKKIVTTGDKKTKIIEVKVKPIPVPLEYSKGTYSGVSIPLEAKCKNPKYTINKRNLSEIIKYFNISDVTNCEQGSFHKWTNKDNMLVCSVCGTLVSNVTNKKDIIDKKIADNYMLNIAKNFCKIQNIPTCDKLEKPQLLKMYSTTQDQKRQQEQSFEEKIEKQEKIFVDKSQKQKEFVNNIKSEYGKMKRHKEDYYKFIDLFIDELERNLGKDRQNLKYDAYIINHDHNGYPIAPFTIINVNDKIMLKKNHTFFKTDVIYYRNFKLQIDVFYDAINKLLLGYKEKDKEYKYAKRTNVYLEINYSVRSMIRQLCYPANLIDITERMENYNTVYKTPEQRLNAVVSDISRERIQGLKKAISDFQKYIYQVAYKYDKPKIAKEDAGDSEDPDKFLDKYKDKLSKIILKQDKSYKFLKNWKGIKYELFFEDITNKNINISPEQKYISIDEISEYDYSGNVILFYIVNEMIKLITVNKDKFIKTTLCHLLIDIIIRIYSEYDQEKDLTNSQIKRFLYILQIKDYSQIDETEIETEGIYEEYKDPDAKPDEELLEENEDAKEEEDALDIEDELDYEVDYAPE
ncbi:MAG: hypothetical protein MUO21_07130 [Nitrososphaeraceae archaeon]|nr:hypothetical protein [Nitrososphaeraceae archaeon]